jgi:acyl carrier protein
VTKKEFKIALQDFVQEIVDGDQKITSQSALFDDGLIDSLKILDLIAFIESNLKIKVLDEKIVIQNFKTIDDICATFFIEEYA